MRALIVAIAAALALSASGCGDDGPTLPDAPMAEQMTDLEAIYLNPTGTIDVANVQSTLDAVDARLTDLHLDWLPALISEALVRLSERIDDVGLVSEGSAEAPTKHTIISAVVELERICRGWTGSIVPDAANGTLDLTAVVEDGKLRSDVWGTASACKTRLDPLDTSVGNDLLAANLSVDAALDVRLYGPLPRSVGEAKFLLLFDGRLGTEERSTDTSFDFLVLDGHLAFRFAVSDGDVIVEIGATSISLRGSNATFTSDLANRSCQ
jgi:hypothetical protein